MDAKTMTQLLVGFLIGAVILASLVPIFINVQNISGDEITLENDTAIVLREAEDGDVLKCERTVITQETTFSDVWSLNNEQITDIGASFLSWNVGIISDSIYLQITPGTSSPVSGIAYDMTKATPTRMNVGAGDLPAESVATWTATFNDGTITITDRFGTSTEYAYTWAYVVCNVEDGQYYSAETSGVGICKTADDLILCGAYTTGEFDTMYYYHEGQSYVSNSAYTISVTNQTSLHEGTTDIYDISVEVGISDGNDTETFTPYRIFLPYEVSGHASEGALYSIIGILPLVAGVGLLMGAVYYFISRR